MTEKQDNRSAYLMMVGIGFFWALMMGLLTWMEIQQGGPAPGEVGIQGNIGRLVWGGVAVIVLWGAIGYLRSRKGADE